MNKSSKLGGGRKPKNCYHVGCISHFCSFSLSVVYSLELVWVAELNRSWPSFWQGKDRAWGSSSCLQLRVNASKERAGVGQALILWTKPTKVPDWTLSPACTEQIADSPVKGKIKTASSEIQAPRHLRQDRVSRWAIGLWYFPTHLCAGRGGGESLSLGEGMDSQRHNPKDCAAAGSLKREVMPPLSVECLLM